MSGIELSGGQKRVLLLILEAGGEAVAESIETGYGSKYVYELLQQLVENKLVEKNVRDGRAFYRLTREGFMIIYPEACKYPEILSRESQKLVIMLKPVLDRLNRSIGFHVDMLFPQSLIKAISSADILNQLDSVSAMHLAVINIIKLCFKNRDLKTRVRASWLQVLVGNIMTHSDDETMSLINWLAEKSLGEILDEIVMFTFSRWRWKAYRCWKFVTSTFKITAIVIGLTILVASIIMMVALFILL